MLSLKYSTKCTDIKPSQQSAFLKIGHVIFYTCLLPSQVKQ